MGKPFRIGHLIGFVFFLAVGLGLGKRMQENIVTAGSMLKLKPYISTLVARDVHPPGSFPTWKDWCLHRGTPRSKAVDIDLEKGNVCQQAIELCRNFRIIQRLALFDGQMSGVGKRNRALWKIKELDLYQVHFHDNSFGNFIKGVDVGSFVCELPSHSELAWLAQMSEAAHIGEISVWGKQLDCPFYVI